MPSIEILVHRTPAALKLIHAAEAGDPAAIKTLQALAHVGDTNLEKSNPNATGTANWARAILNRTTGANLPYYKGDSALAGIGRALKVLAPVAAALIPGVGPVVAGALAAGGNSLGQALTGDKFNVGGALLAGVGGGVGSAALGGQGINALGGGAAAAGIPAAPSGVAGATAQGLAGAPSSIGGLTTGLGGAAAGAVPALAPVASAAGAAGAVVPSTSVLGTLGHIGGVISKNLPLIGGVLGTITGASQQSHANDLQNQAVQQAMQDWQARAPVRAAAIQRTLAPLPTAPDLSYIYQGSSNPYVKVRPA